MTKDIKQDDFDAVRALVDTLSPFEVKERERIIRWACEKLGMKMGFTSGSALQFGGSPIENSHVIAAGAATPAARQTGDIKSFVLEKNPKSDQQLAAVVAYYYKFEAPPDERKESVGGTDLRDACRKVNRKRPPNPSQTMLNAFNAGYFDKVESGKYRLNTVGENLVAMVLPAGASDAVPHITKRRISMARTKKKR